MSARTVLRVAALGLAALAVAAAALAALAHHTGHHGFRAYLCGLTLTDVLAAAAMTALAWRGGRR